MEIVPPEDVPVVAARIAERLAMPVERVEKLISERTGPITRPLRPDKAEAIAQTFEAAGVVVAIRPSDDEDEIGRDAPPEPEREPNREPEPADLPGQDPEPEPADVPGPEPEPIEDPPVDGVAGGAVGDADGTPPRADPERHAPPPRPHGAGAAARSPAPLRIEPERDVDDDPDDDGPDGEGLEARGEIPPRRRPLVVELTESDRPPLRDVREHGSLEAAGLRGASDRAPGPPNGEERRRVPRTESAPARLVVPDAGAASADRPGGGAARAFTDDASWNAPDDASGGWTVPRRRGEPAAPDDHGADDAEPLVVDDGTGVSATRPELDDDAFEGARDAVDIEAGREADADRDADHGLDDGLDDDGLDDADDLGDDAGFDHDTEAAADDLEHEDDPVSESVVDEYDTPRGVSAGHLAAEDGGDAGWDAAEGATDERDDIDEPDDPDEPAPRGRAVPIAWRGLGGEESGPARPADARVPQRLDPEEERALDEARRVTIRRTIMLWALVIAVALFVWSQFWANGRTMAAFDEGMQRYREADFTAARQVWSRLASVGDANAQFMLGYMHEVGLGQPWSARAAAESYRLAAEAGHVEAQWRLGTLHDRGLGVAWSPAEAHAWWAAAAAGGHAEAAFTLGRALFSSASSPSDLVAAEAAFDRARALGWPDASRYHTLLSVVSGAPNAGALR